MNKALIACVLVVLACPLSWAQDKFSHVVGPAGSSMSSYTETHLSGGRVGIDATVSLGAGTGGRSTLTLIPLNAGDTPIEWLNVTATSGTSNRYLAVSVSCPDFPTKRVSYITAAQRDGGSRPVIFGCGNVGQLGVSDSSTTFSFSSYGQMGVIKDVGESHTGNVYADLVATAQPSGETGASGDFNDSFVVEGDFLSSISTPGNVNPVVITGVLGSSTRPASLTANRFARIDAASFVGEIDATGTTSSDGIGQVTITGDAVGTIFTERIGTTSSWPGVWDIDGDLDADVVVREDVDAESGASPATVIVGGEFTAGRVFVIGGTLAGGASGVGGIKITDTGGLKGQIIVNANDASDDWLGDVTIGSTVLDPGASGTDFAYATASTTLGGGAVGLVSYSMHPVDSEPDDGATVCTVGTQEWPEDAQVRETIVLGIYGRVFDSAAGGSIPLVVERKDMVCGPPPCSPPWVDISADCEVLMSPNGNDREVWISLTPVGGEAQSFGMAYFYRITPRGSGNPVVTDLRSDNTLAATAPNVYAFEYNLTLLCDAFQSMLDRDGFLSADSLEAWARDPTDVNGDGVVDSADLAWFADRMDR